MGVSGADNRGAKAKVMVLGTYHMANPGKDLVKVGIRDTLSPERQTEIQLLNVRLLRFEPTKIAVEATEASRVNERFATYLQDRVELSAGEVEQIGFRLAKSLGHTRLYGVDYRGDMDFDKLTAFSRKKGQDWFPDL